MIDLASRIRDVPDFPQKGILFKDITTLLKDGPAFKSAIDSMTSQVREWNVEVVVGMESRGFIFAAPIAYKLGVGFAPVRKLGKLPAETISAEYALEYGTNTLEAARRCDREGQRVLVVDDLLATGGTVGATIDLVERLGGEVVGTAFLVELTSLNGRRAPGRVPRHDAHQLLRHAARVALTGMTDCPVATPRRAIRPRCRDRALAVFQRTLVYSPRSGPPPARMRHSTTEDSRALIKRGGGTGPTKPGNPRSRGQMVRRAGRCQFRQDAARVLEDEKRRSSAQGSLLAGTPGRAFFDCARSFVQRTHPVAIHR